MWCSMFSFEMSTRGRLLLFWSVWFTILRVADDMKQFGTQTQCAAAMEASKQTERTEILIDSAQAII